MTEAEQIAERLAPPHSEVCRSHASGVCDCWRTRQRIAILAALREAEARTWEEVERWKERLKAVCERAEQAERDLRDIIENDEGQRERANKIEAEVERLRSKLTATQVRANEYAAEVERLREALEGLLESPASFEDSRIDYAERQVDTKVWDEAKAALAGRPGAERAPADEPKG